MESRVVTEPLQVAGQLLHPVDLPATLDLDGDRLTLVRPTEEIDRTDVRGVLAPEQGEAGLQRPGLLSEQLLEVRLDAILLQPGVLPQLHLVIREHLVEPDGELFVLRVGDHPLVRFLYEAVRGIHPVQRLVGTAVGVDGHTAVRLHHDQTSGERQVRREPALVVDGASRDDESHGRARVPDRQGGPLGTLRGHAPAGLAPRRCATRCCMRSRVRPARLRGARDVATVPSAVPRSSD